MDITIQIKIQIDVLRLIMEVLVHVIGQQVVLIMEVGGQAMIHGKVHGIIFIIIDDVILIVQHVMVVVNLVLTV